MNKKTLGILVGGGPAPGINSVISAVTIEARNSGLEVIGFYDGFAHLMEGDTESTRQLHISDVSQIHFQGGSILRTSRANPTREKQHLEQVIQSLQQLNVNCLVTIGGDDTAFSALEVARSANGAIQVAHVPKTIDNDLPLPGNMPTFGFETARHYGTALVRNLMEDSRTTNRWYFIVTMGRSSGHLALGIAKAAGATLAVIPEEFDPDTVTLDRVCQVLEGSILKRRVMGRNRGLAVVAEGIIEMLRPEELASIPEVEVSYDEHGHIRLGDIPFERILKWKIQQRLAERGEKMDIVARNIGYELRSASPIPYDVDYTRTLGYGAVRALLGSRENGLVYLLDGRLGLMPFTELTDPETQRTRIRRVDINSEYYRVARKYMIRLESEDLANQDMSRKLAEYAGVGTDEFTQRFAPAA